MIPRQLAFLGTLALTGCASLNQIGEEGGTNSGIGNAVVIEDDSFEASRGSMLTILQMHVRSMVISRENECPHIIVRGGVGRSKAAEALVYVDGQRMSDTCVLDGLAVDAVERAEVYPSGVTNRPGYHSNTGGLILVFMKNGNDAQVWR